MDKRDAYLLALVAVLFWSFNVIIARYLADNLTPVETSFGRWFFALVFVLPFTIKPISKEWEVIKANFKLIAFLGILGVALLNTLVYKAGQTASAVNMSLIGTVGPVFSVIFAWLIFKAHISKKQIIGLLVSLFGVVLIITKGHIATLDKFTLVTGDFWMLAMTVVFGLYSIFQTLKPKKLSQSTLIAVEIVIAVIVLLPFFIWDLATAKTMPEMTAGVWSVLIYMGILPSLVSFIAWNKAISVLGALKTNMIYYLMPVFSTIEAFFILDENISSVQIIGGVVVLFGVFITDIHGRRKMRIIRA